MKGLIATGFFRTGSTFIFSCLRQIERFRCYYEPYHPELLDFVNDSGDNAAPDKLNLGHSLSDDYYSEFYELDLNVLSNCYASIKRDTNHPILFANSEHETLKKYIELLRDDAVNNGKIPVYQPNRFNFMLPWLKSEYPDFYLVLITRNPASIFYSLQSLASKAGLTLTPDERSVDFWNVGEIFKILIGVFSGNYTGRLDFGYYQKLYFIIKFIEFYAGKYADLVIDYDEFSDNYPVLLKNIGIALDVNMDTSVEYVKNNLKITPAKPTSNELLCLEKEVVPLLNFVKVNCVLNGC
ncbi:hypothetical protein AltI4_07420 [Alteromonas sp. I4]|nr:hypothetical protein AltI4_07420 [Alteromonas sp. I4]